MLRQFDFQSLPVTAELAKPGGKTEGLLDTDLKVALNLIDPYETSGFGFGIRMGYRIPGTYKIAKVPHGIGKRVQAASAELLAGYSIASVTLESAIGYRFSASPAPTISLVTQALLGIQSKLRRWNSTTPTSLDKAVGI